MKLIKPDVYLIDLRYDWATPWGSAIEERRLRASRPVITPLWPISCRCRYVTLRFRTKNICWPETMERANSGSPQVALCESEAAATNVLTVRKRSGSYKAFSRNEINPQSMVMIHINRNIAPVVE